MKRTLIAVLVAAAALLIFSWQAEALFEVGTNDFRISTLGPDGDNSYEACYPDIVTNTTTGEMLVLWDADTSDAGLVLGEEEIWGQLYAPDGTTSGPHFRVSNVGTDGDPAFDARYPAAAYNPTANEYLVVWWGDAGIDGELEIYGQRLDANGSEVGADDFRISTMGPDGDTTYIARYPIVTYNPTADEYLVVWEGTDAAFDESEIYGQRLDANGNQIGADDFRISTMGVDGDPTANAQRPVVIHNADANEYLVTWYGNDVGELEIYIQRLDAAGAEIGGDDVRISTMGPASDSSYVAEKPVAVYNPTTQEYLVTWFGSDATIGELEIYGQRLDAAGAEVGTDDFRISDMGPDGDVAYSAFDPAVVVDPVLNEYLVVWWGDDAADSEDEIYGQLLDSQGTPIEENDFRISDVGPDGNTAYDAFAPEADFNAVTGEVMIAWQGVDVGGALVAGEEEIWGQYLLMDGIIRNGSYEVEGPAHWSLNGSDDEQWCSTFSYIGDCGLLFRASPDQVEVATTFAYLTTPGSTGETVTLEYRIRLRDVPSEGLIGARLQLKNTTTNAKQSEVCSTIYRGTIPWVQLTCSITATVDGYDRVRVELGWKDVYSGFMLIDDVNAYITP